MFEISLIFAVSLTSMVVPGLSKEISLVTYLETPDVFLDLFSGTNSTPEVYPIFLTIHQSFVFAG